MVRLVVHSKLGQQQFQAKVRQSVREILDTTALRVRAACGGTGTCGACRIRLAKGTVSPLTVAEYMKLSPLKRIASKLLAYQLRLHSDAKICLSQPASPLPWKSILRLCLCGAFGRTLNIQHTQDLGLLPKIEPIIIELHSDTGLAACEQALLTPERLDQFLVYGAS